MTELNENSNIEPVKLHELTRQRYLNYALSVITSRALPDVRDGLKPVQRRILYAMYHDLKLRKDSRFLKSARVVGDVMGKYHPHGDQSIYEAMVRMSQSFSLRYPLVDGYGNFGSLDGDSAAAMRYTEARLNGLAEGLLKEIDKDTIQNRLNYDGQLEEPTILPAQFPNLLLNGVTGIAVGMATHIPPHQLNELIDALNILIKNPDASTKDLFTVFNGPDFPTGGEILNDQDELISIYEKGTGTIKLRGTYHLEDDGKNQFVIIDSIPFEVQKSALVEKIAQCIIEKKLPQLLDIRDESTDIVRIVLEVKKGESCNAVMAYLYKHTPLQQNFSLNMTCLIPSDPKDESKALPQRVGLKECLQHFLDFRFSVVVKRLQFDLSELERAIHRLEALEKIYGNLDEAIELIRKAKNKHEAELALMNRFILDEEQANVVLDIKLYRLAQLEIEEVKKELADKRKKANEIKAILNDKNACWKVIKDEFKTLLKDFGDQRKSKLVGPQVDEDFSPEAYVIKEDCWVIVTRQGRIKRQKGLSELSALRIQDGDELGWSIFSNTQKTVTIFTQLGKAYSILIADLNATSGYGDPLQAIFKFDDGERVVGVCINDQALYPMVAKDLIPKPESDKLEGLEDDSTEKNFDPPYAIAVSRKGLIHRFPLNSYAEVSQKNGRTYFLLEGNDEIVACYSSRGHESVVLASVHGRGLIFHSSTIPIRQKSSKGCLGMKLVGEDEVLGFVLVDDPMQGLWVYTGAQREFLIRETHSAKSPYKKTKRGTKGQDVILRGNFEKWLWPVQILRTSTEGKLLLGLDAIKNINDESVKQNTVENNKEDKPISTTALIFNRRPKIVTDDKKAKPKKSIEETPLLDLENKDQE